VNVAPLNAMKGGTTPFVLNRRITYRYAVSHRSRPIYPGKRTEIRIEQGAGWAQKEGGWAPKPVWTFRTGGSIVQQINDETCGRPAAPRPHLHTPPIYVTAYLCTGLFKMTVGVLTTCHTQHT